MKKWFKSLNIYFKVTICSLLTILVVFLGMLFCYFNGNSDIPNGFLLGSLIQIIFYVVLGLIEKKDESKQSMTGAIVVGVIRLFVFLGLAIGNAILYYKANFQVFNVITMFIGYPIPLIWLVIFYLTNRRKDGDI